jgi:hypothetical protein
MGTGWVDETSPATLVLNMTVDIATSQFPLSLQILLTALLKTKSFSLCSNFILFFSRSVSFSNISPRVFSMIPPVLFLP